MELGSKNTKKIIDCLSEHDFSQETQTSWYFSVLAHDEIEVEFFDELNDHEMLDYGDIVSWCLNLLSYSSAGARMISEACDQDWQVMLDDLQGGEYCIDVERKFLTIDNNALCPSALGRSGDFRNLTLVTLIKALRDIWQENRHGGFDELYSPEHILLMERIRAADLDVLAIMIAWELRAQGFTDFWRHMIGSEIGDMAMTFSGYLERDPSAQFNNQGAVAAFKQWFREKKRVNECDHDALEYLDEVLFSSEEENPFGRKKPSKMNIEVLSCLPDKTAYLQGMGVEILSNPEFSAVDDAINQTHLFHIMYDLEAIVVEDVPFRDAELARKIFPQD